jgi:hypothetical protein
MGFLKRPKAPEPTAQELAGVARQSRMIDEETEEMEKRLKAAARGKLGSKSLLAKAKSSTSGSSPTRRSGGYGAGGTGGNTGVNSFLSGSSAGGTNTRLKTGMLVSGSKA